MTCAASSAVAPSRLPSRLANAVLGVEVRVAGSGWPQSQRATSSRGQQSGRRAAASVPWQQRRTRVMRPPMRGGSLPPLLARGAPSPAAPGSGQGRRRRLHQPQPQPLPAGLARWRLGPAPAGARHLSLAWRPLLPMELVGRGRDPQATAALLGRVWFTALVRAEGLAVCLQGMLQAGRLGGAWCMA